MSVPGEEASKRTTLKDIIDAEILSVGTELVSIAARYPCTAYLTAGGEINLQGKTFSTPSGAGKACMMKHYKGNQRRESAGWNFWYAKRANGELVALDHFRKQYEKSRVLTPDFDPQAEESLEINLSSLISNSILEVGETIFSRGGAAKAIILQSGTIQLDNQEFRLLKDAAKHVEYGNADDDRYINGWKYWHVLRGKRLTPLSALRDLIQ